MPDVIPQPSPEDVPFNEPVKMSVPAGSEGRATFTPKQRNTRFILPIVAVSKETDTTYQVEIDGTTVYGPAAAPPTDVDDLAVTFTPAYEFRSEMIVSVANLGTAERNYIVQPVGYEPAGGAP